MDKEKFEERLKRSATEFARVVPFDNNDRLLLMDFTENNTDLNSEILNNTDLFIGYINSKLKKCQCEIWDWRI